MLLSPIYRLKNWTKYTIRRVEALEGQEMQLTDPKLKWYASPISVVQLPPSPLS